MSSEITLSYGDIRTLVSFLFFTASIIFLFYLTVRLSNSNNDKPRYKEGDWVKQCDEVGEFTVKPGDQWFYIKAVGKNSYLTDFYGKRGNQFRLITTNYETTLYSKYYEKTSAPSLTQEVV
jgi:hypothetical protein